MEICININVKYLQKKKIYTEAQITEKYRYINMSHLYSNMFQLSPPSDKKKLKEI